MSKPSTHYHSTKMTTTACHRVVNNYSKRPLKLTTDWSKVTCEQCLQYKNALSRVGI
jgi:hypothetical protein